MAAAWLDGLQGLDSSGGHFGRFEVVFGDEDLIYFELGKRRSLETDVVGMEEFWGKTLQPLERRNASI